MNTEVERNLNYIEETFYNLTDYSLHGILTPSHTQDIEVVATFDRFAGMFFGKCVGLLVSLYRKAVADGDDEYGVGTAINSLATAIREVDNGKTSLVKIALPYHYENGKVKYATLVYAYISSVERGLPIQVHLLGKPIYMLTQSDIASFMTYADGINPNPDYTDPKPTPKPRVKTKTKTVTNKEFIELSTTLN